MCNTSVWSLLPCHRDTGEPSGLFPGKVVRASAEPSKYSCGKFFTATEHRLTGPRDLFDVVSRLADEGREFIVPGTVIEGGVIQKCYKPGTDRWGRPNKVCLAAEPRRLCLLDLDECPNVSGKDPRTAAQEVLDAVVGILPRAVRIASWGWDWSSTYATKNLNEDGTPKDTRLHVWLLFDRDVSPEEIREMLALLNLRLRRVLRERGFAVDPGAKVVDGRMWLAMQPHYVARPRFEDGIEDPFPGELRRGFRQGEAEFCDFGLLMEELGQEEVVAKAKGPRPAKALRDRAVKTGEKAVRVASLAQVRRELEARKLVGVRKRADLTVGYEEACYSLGANRKLRELIEVTCHYRELGETNPEYAEWTRCGGFPDGRRSEYMCIIGGLVTQTLPWGLPRARVREEILSVGRLVCDHDYLDEWVGRGYDGGVLDSYEAGEIVDKDTGAKTDRLYKYSKKRIMAEFEITEEIAMTLRLVSLDTPAVESALRRQKAGAATRGEFLAAKKASFAERDRRVASLQAAGLTTREIASRLGLSNGALVRSVARIKADPSIAAAAPVHVEPTNVVQIQPEPARTAAVPAAEAEKEGLTSAVIYRVRRSKIQNGCETVPEIVSDSGLSERTVKAVLEYLRRESEKPKPRPRHFRRAA